LNSTFAVPQVPPVPSNVEIEGGEGGACGTTKGKIVVPTFELNSCIGANASLAFESALAEPDPGSLAGAAVLLLACGPRCRKDADEVEKSGMPISTIKAISVPMRIIE